LTETQITSLSEAAQRLDNLGMPLS
jgi:hypothetical protein